MRGPGDGAPKRHDLREPTQSKDAEGHAAAPSQSSKGADVPPGSWSSARAHMPPVREPRDLVIAPEQLAEQATSLGEQPKMDAGSREESDEVVVPKKSPNSRVTPEEAMEGRTSANEEMRARTPGPDSDPECWAHAIERIGRVASERKGERFTTLLSHMKAPLLKEAYQRLRKNAAAGVDGETWESYGDGLDARLLDLEGRIHRGSYHPQPVRRVHIPKTDGKMRPLGIPTLEDKIVQQAARMLMEPIYERSEFIGVSYGYRPGRSQHDALDALAVALMRRVSWVLDGDIQAFFDTIDHGWMQRFIEERIADSRFVRLLMKMLRAGVMEERVVRDVEEGTPQGGIISPLLANIYLHYALDRWVLHWRKTEARGEVYYLRYADDFVMAFQHRDDANAARTLVARRLKEHQLTLHPEKTRVLRFGRFAPKDAHLDGRTKPETFTFLGLTHICAVGKDGVVRIVRRTSRKKRRAKLAAVRDEIRARRHEPVADQHRWLSAVLVGHYRYYGVPGNEYALASFRHGVWTAWVRTLARRSQRARWKAGKLALHCARFPLPHAKLAHPNPRARFTTRRLGGGSPVREIRTPGSVRGAPS